MNKMATEPMIGTETEAAKVGQVGKFAINKDLLRTILMLIMPAVLLVGGGYYWLTSGGSVSTSARA